MEDHWLPHSRRQTRGSAQPEQFQFAQRTIDFAGFRISTLRLSHSRNIQSLSGISQHRHLRPTSDLGSVWLTKQRTMLNSVIYETIRVIIEPKDTRWSVNLEIAFQASKSSIIEAIRHGIETFDLRRRTCIRNDLSKNGIGYFLSQKHCACVTTLPGCWDDGWNNFYNIHGLPFPYPYR